MHRTSFPPGGVFSADFSSSYHTKIHSNFLLLCFFKGFYHSLPAFVTNIQGRRLDLGYSGGLKTRWSLGRGECGSFQNQIAGDATALRDVWWCHVLLKTPLLCGNNTLRPVPIGDNNPT